MRRLMRAGTVWLAALALQGCATLMNGVVQPVKIESEKPVEVVLDGIPEGKTPVVVNLTRKKDHVVELSEVEGGLVTAIKFDHRTSGWVWANFCFFIYGLGGVAFDYLVGGAYKMVPLDTAGLSDTPARISLSMDVDPWSVGIWHTSLAYHLGAKKFPGKEIQPQLGFQMVVGKNSWPIDAVVNGYFYSAALEIDNVNLLEVGLRKTFFPQSDRVHPHFGGGLTWMAKSTQGNAGFPLGFWGRAGVDLRMSRHIFIGPYFGYSKYETVLSGVNTGGPEFGVMLGMMW